jgi:acyl-CoA synthetase (AMP-forming)/AMP-acid ligase II
LPNSTGTVAVRCGDVYFHWLLLGFERLAVTTVSLDDREGEEAAAFLSTIDLTLSGAPISTPTAFQLITPEWRRRILEADTAVDAAVPRSAGDAPLPEGAAGWVRVKSDGLFSGYLDDPETNRRMIRDGWFYPGDVGMLLGDRRVKILGRGRRADRYRRRQIRAGPAGGPDPRDGAAARHRFLQHPEPGGHRRGLSGRGQEAGRG